MTTTFCELTIPADVTLPALSTEVAEQRYSFLTFLSEWAIRQPGPLADESLAHLFAIEDAVESLVKEAGGDLGGVVGKRLRLPVEARDWAKGVAKAAIDAKMTPDAEGKCLPLAWAHKVLRHYHAFASAPIVDAPSAVDALAVPNAERERMAQAMTNGASDVAAAPPAS